MIQESEKSEKNNEKARHENKIVFVNLLCEHIYEKKHSQLDTKGIDSIDMKFSLNKGHIEFGQEMVNHEWYSEHPYSNTIHKSKQEHGITPKFICVQNVEHPENKSGLDDIYLDEIEIIGTHREKKSRHNDEKTKNLKRFHGRVILRYKKP